MKTLSRTTVIERLERNNELALKALEKGVSTVRSASDKAKATVVARVPKVDLPTVPVPSVIESAVEKNVEFAKAVLHAQAEFVSKAVRTVTGQAPTAKKASAKASSAKKATKPAAKKSAAKATVSA